MSDYEGKGIWCIAELRHGTLVPTIYELLTPARKLADARGETVTALLLGGSVSDETAGSLAECGADAVTIVQNDALKEFVDEAYCAALNSLISASKPRTVLLPATVFGRSLAPRIAVAQRGSLAADAIGLELDDRRRLVLTRSSYAGNVVATVSLDKGLEVATVRPMAFERARPGAKKGGVGRAEVSLAALPVRTEYVGFNPDSSGEIDMSGAEKIVSGGRGLGNPEGFELIRRLAKTLGAAVGASRATVDAGWIPYKHQVGLTGRSVRPRLYIACGISGQIQHLAGMKSSDVIVAINTDGDCPMMKLATYAVQGDLYKIIPALIDEIGKARGETAQQNGR